MSLFPRFQFTKSIALLFIEGWSTRRKTMTDKEQTEFNTLKERVDLAIAECKLINVQLKHLIECWNEIDRVH
jgi:hypothetical protein